ncbi:hypothetical protein B0H21DRAFT_754997 [Amylocystis lapponica]|nr:hypothetical protein B0H21DRAFT_754997 [Amylocystis lapponica]
MGLDDSSYPASQRTPPVRNTVAIMSADGSDPTANILLRNMLLSFPTDLSLYIFSFLPLQDLRSLLLVSRQIHGLVADNEATVYHQAAILHNFVMQRTSLEDAKRSEDQPRGTGLDAVRTWKELCRWWTVFDRNWDIRKTLRRELVLL